MARFSLAGSEVKESVSVSAPSTGASCQVSEVEEAFLFTVDRIEDEEYDDRGPSHSELKYGFFADPEEYPA